MGDCKKSRVALSWFQWFFLKVTSLVAYTHTDTHSHTRARLCFPTLQESDFAVEERPVPALEDGQVVVEVAIFSLDPTHRGWAATDTYMPAVSTHHHANTHTHTERRPYLHSCSACRGGLLLTAPTTTAGQD